MYITYDCKDTGNTGRIEFGYFSPTSSDYSYDASTSSITISLSGLSSMLTSEYGGGILGSHIKIPKTDEKGNSQYDEHGHQIYITIPSVMSLGEGSSLDNNLIKWILNPKWENDENSSMNISDVIPIAGVYVETMGVGVRFWNLPHDIDFETDVSRMDMIKKVIELCYDEERGSTWIDENRILHVSGRQELRRYESPVVYWRDISKLVISQSINTDDTGFYNVVEVYGKDNEYYAICDNSRLDGILFRKKTMTFSELMSDKECQIRADWEAYKSRYGHESITVTLVNRYVDGFDNPSNKVGRTIEIETPDGELNLFWLDKISYSGNTITLSLTYFIPMYDNLSYRYTDTLRVPYISGHKVLEGNILRLYVDGEDIDYGVVRLYENFAFRKCSVQRDKDGRRYVDFEYTHSGEYKFRVNLYSPYYEASGFGGIRNDESAYRVTVEYIPSRVPVDPYPHPDSTASTNEYLVNEMNEKLTDENGQRIYI